jgi:hypothetical protein
MSAHSKDQLREMAPVIVTAIVAVVGAAVIFFMDFGPSSSSQGSGGGGMITASTLFRAGAIAHPTEPRGVSSGD